MTKINRAYVSSAVAYPASLMRLTAPEGQTLVIERYKVTAAQDMTKSSFEPFEPDGMTAVWEIDGHRPLPDAPILVHSGQTAVLWVFCREPDRVWFWSTMGARLE